MCFIIESYKIGGKNVFKIDAAFLRNCLSVTVLTELSVTKGPVTNDEQTSRPQYRVDINRDFQLD